MRAAYQVKLLLPVLLALASCGGQEAGVSAPRSAKIRSASALPDDHLYLGGLRANFSLIVANGVLTVTDNVDDTGTRSFPLPKRVVFADTVLSFEAEGSPGAAFRLYQAAFGRKPDAAGLGFWIGAMNQGLSIEQVAAHFVVSDEFKAMYANATTNTAVVTQFYQNILRRAPDQSGLDFWVGALNSGVPLAVVLAHISDSAENRARVAPAIANGFEFQPYPPPTYAVHDYFDEPELNSCRWFDWSQGKGSVAHSNGLVMRTSADAAFSNPRIISQFSARDDFSFDVQVNVDEAFELAIPDGTQKYAGIGLLVDASNYFRLSLAREGNRTVVKPLVRRANALLNAPVAVVSGRTITLRVASSGGVISYGYFSPENSNYISLGSVPGLGDGEYLISLDATTIGVQQQFAASFKNFHTGSGATSNRPYIRGPLVARPDFQSGGVLEGGYIYETLWAENPAWGNVNLFSSMAANGMKWQRTTVTTQSVASLRNTPVSAWKTLAWDGAFWQAQEVTAESLRLGQEQGMGSILSFFFSDKAANSSFQDAPAAWKGLSLEATAEKMRLHTQAVATDYKARGLKIAMYEIGNEIEFGIANFRAGERLPMPPSGDVVAELSFMRDTVWAAEATLLKAAIAGVKSVDPQAKIVLHASMIGKSPADSFVKAFYKAMKDFGVAYDIAGLSLPYPESEWTLHKYTTSCWFQRLQETTDYIARLGKKSMISEASYSNTTAGVRAVPMRDFPYTDEGQVAWIREHLRFANNNSNITGFMYFYPDWYPGRSRDNQDVVVLDSYGLFFADKTARPGLKVFQLPASSPP